MQPWLVPLALLVLWQVTTDQQWIDGNILVSPLAVLETTWHGLLDGTLIGGMALSLGRTLGGLLLGGGLGFALGLLLGLSRTSERVLGPTLAAIRQIAIFAWVPLLTAWFGLGELAKWVFVALAAFSRCSSPPNAASPTSRRNSTKQRKCCA